MAILLAGAFSQVREAELKERVKRFLLVVITGLAGYIAWSILAIFAGGSFGETIVRWLPLLSASLAFALSFFLFFSSSQRG